MSQITEPSIVIPWVFSNLSENRIKEVFEILGFGDVVRIDIKKKDGHNTVFVHLNWCENNEEAIRVRNILIAREEEKIVYDDPWYWMIRASNSTRPENYIRKKKEKTKPFIEF